MPKFGMRHILVVHCKMMYEKFIVVLLKLLQVSIRRQSILGLGLLGREADFLVTSIILMALCRASNVILVTR